MGENFNFYHVVYQNNLVVNFYEVRSVSDRYSFGIGRYIGLADMGKPYRYRLSVSADKKIHIGSLPI